MEDNKRTTKLVVVKNYESKLDGEKVKLILYRKGERYGVVSHFPGAAVAQDYKNGDIASELRTMIENEDEIIDWVTIVEANERYVSQLMQLINSGKRSNSTTNPSSAPRLRIIHSA